MHPKTIQKLIDLFAKFPTIGPRTATRFVFYLLKLPKNEIEILISSISELKNTIKTCKSCFNSFEPPKIILERNEKEFCEICRNVKRDKTLLCVVEKETDLISIEKTKKYRGLYFILGGLISAFKKREIKDLRINELIKRVKKGNEILSHLHTSPRLRSARASEELKEIIIALNPTTQGQATALYLERLLKKNFHGRVTRLGQGLPIGGELEYADEETLSSALENRKLAEDRPPQI